MSDVQNLVGRLRQIAESQWMDFDSPNVAATLDDAATTLEALASIGSVVAEEPGWEYGVRLTGGDRDRRTAGYIYRWPSLAQAEDQAALNFDASAEFFTRIKAGPWVPVKQEGAE